MLTNKELRIIYSLDLLSGSFNFEGINIKENEDKKTMKIDQSIKSSYQISLGENMLRDMSLKAVIDQDNVVLNGNIMFQVESDRINFNHTIAALDNTIVFLGQDELLQQRLYSWEDYLQYIKGECGWLIWLKAALDIFNGSIKGLHNVPTISKIRKEELILKLKELIAIASSELIMLFYGNKGNFAQQVTYSDNSAIK